MCVHCLCDLHMCVFLFLFRVHSSVYFSCILFRHMCFCSVFWFVYWVFECFVCDDSWVRFYLSVFVCSFFCVLHFRLCVYFVWTSSLCVRRSFLWVCICLSVHLSVSFVFNLCVRLALPCCLFCALFFLFVYVCFLSCVFWDFVLVCVLWIFAALFCVSRVYCEYSCVWCVFICVFFVSICLVWVLCLRLIF